MNHRVINYSVLFVLVFTFIASFLFAQEGIPLTKKYSVENYHAGIENWDAVQDINGIMYFANSEGILEFDGVHWRLIRTTSGTKIRSLEISQNDTIYVGGDGDFGYLKEDINGQKYYSSLKANLPEKYHEHLGHVWKVIIEKEYLFFLAEGSVLIFDQKHNFIKILNEDIYLRSLFKVENEVYAYSNRNGLLLFDPQRMEFIPYYNDVFLLDRHLEFLTRHPKGGLRLHIFDKGFFRLYNNTLIFEKKYTSSPIDTDHIFCQGKINDLLLFGTTSNGFYAIKDEGLSIKYHFDRSLGLNDNKVFSIYTDHDNNVWICHENGLSYIEFNTPVRFINEKLGVNGTGYCTSMYDSMLFVGTSHGLYASELGGESGFYNFDVFKLIRQPTYFLEQRGQSLLIGCLLEVFEFDGKNLKVLSKNRNNNKILALPGDPNIYLVSNKEGFTIFEYKNGFYLRNKVNGLDLQVLDFNIDQNENIWILNKNHEILKGRLNPSRDSIHLKQPFQALKDIKFLSISIYNNKLIVGTEKGIFSENNGRLSSIDKDGGNSSGKYPVHWLYNQNEEELWYEKSRYADGNLSYRIDILSENIASSKANNLNSVIYGNKAFSFGNFSDSQLAIGTSEGFLLYGLEFESQNLNKAETYIRKITVSDIKDTTVLAGIWIHGDNSFKLPLKQEVTEIQLECAANYFYSIDKVRYSYKLEGSGDQWSDWSRDNKIRFTINDDGEYIFHVRSTSNLSAISNISSYKFIIEKPWYKTYWWYGVELGILILIMALSVYFNRHGSTKISKISAFMLILLILTIFEIFSELVQDWMDAQGVTIFALRVSINISIALTINPMERWLRKKLILRGPQSILQEQDLVLDNSDEQKER
ncbi:MAG: triple tyrosine motif-containing protein [Cytophagaceae bacterium]